ncbi:MAG TPA: hypothetical protein PK280_08930 [Planctomycetota bacterium]|nr:hypothetical protein [Planctomycetota bacterium]
MSKLPPTRAVLAAILLVSAAAAWPARGAEPAPDFKSARPADPDFNLSFELELTGGDEFLVAVGNDAAYAFARFTAKRRAVLGALAGGRKSGDEVAAALPAAPGVLVLKFRSASGRFLTLTDGRSELARVRLPELEGAPLLAFAGGGTVRVRGIQKVDRSEAVLFSDDFTRQGASLAPWSPQAGGGPAAAAWRVNADPNPGTSASPFALECSTGAGPSMIRAGQAFWDDYLVRAAANVLESPGAAGLAASLAEDGSGYLLRLVAEGAGSGGAGRAELVRMAGGGEKVLASRPVAVSPRSWYELELAFSGGVLRASVDGAELAALSGLEGLSGGPVGLWSSGLAPTRFDDVRVEALGLEPGSLLKGDAGWQLAARRWRLPPPALPDYFRNDRTMQTWARLEDEYTPAGGGFWHRAALVGDQEISWKAIGGVKLAAGQLVLALAGDGADFASGYRLVADLGTLRESGGALLAVFEKDRRVAGALVPLAGAGIESLAFSREAGRLVVRVGSRAVLSAPDTLALPGGRAGARAMGGWRLDRDQLATSGAGLLDEVFSRAPVEWRAVCGDWDIASRWKCDPEYTWMLGRARKQLARMDLKRPVGGDFRLDLHFAVGMAERPGPFYDAPVNLSISLSPDAEDPGAGYVFAFAGPDGPSRILRAGRSVAEGDVLVRTTSRSADGGFLHSHWFGLRVIRHGGRLAFWGDNEKLAEFEDPEPIRGAEHLSVWTRGDNGAVVSRIRIEAAGPLGARRSPFAGKPVAVDASAGLPPALAAFRNCDGTNGAMLVPDGKRGVLRLVDPKAGGTFAASWAPPGGVDLARTGCLKFDWRSSPGSRVNLYLVRRGVFYRARLSGPAARVGGRYNLRHLGDVPSAAAGGGDARSLSLNLAGALAAAAPGLSDLRVDEIRIGNYEVEDTALLEGLGGNRAGDWVELSGWRLEPLPADAAAAADLVPRRRPPAAMPPRLVEPAPLDCDDFEKGLGSWESFGGLDGAQLVRDDTRPAPGGGNWCLLGENRRCGGTMGAMARMEPLDVRRFPVLSFDYCVEPLTTVNLLVFSARGRHDILLTDHDGGADRIGAVPDARADGRWHRAVVDLGAVLSARGMTVVRQIGLADLGPGSSTTASAWRIDNWTLLPAVDGSKPLRFRWTLADGTAPAASAAVLDREPNTLPEEKTAIDGGGLEQPAGLAAGLWHLHVRCRDRAGQWGPAAHWPIKVVHYDDRKPPAVLSVSPAAGETACPPRIEVRFSEEGSGLSGHDVAVEVGGRTFRPGDPGVFFVPTEKRLAVDLAGFDGRLIAAPGPVRCRALAADCAGNGLEKPFEWTWQLDLSKDAAAPAAPRPIHLPSERLVFEDFETDQGEFAEWRRATCHRVEGRSRGEAGSGRWYLGTSGRRWFDNNNEAQLHPHPFDPERMNLLAFDYRLKRDIGLSFMIQAGNQWRYFAFGSGAWHSRGNEGQLGRAVVDGAWHRAEIDLRTLRGRLAAGPDGRLPVLQNLLVTFGSQEGMDLDNFVLGSSASRGAEFVWEAPAAASGVAGYAWLLDDRPETAPPEKDSGAEPRAAFADLKPGRYWFHVRARNGAGTWGPAGHAGFSVEK